MGDTVGADERVAVFQRIGWTPSDRLAWLLEEVQQRDRLPGDDEIARLGLAAVAATDIERIQQDLSNLSFLSPERDQPPLKEVPTLLGEARRLIALAIAKQPVPLGELATRALVWNPDKEQFQLLAVPARMTWELRVRRAVVLLLSEHGHHLYACQAQAPRRSTACGRWFLSPDPRARYCSDNCRVRESQRAHRARRAGRQQRATRSKRSRTKTPA
jgi:hypothetical protein